MTRRRAALAAALAVALAAAPPARGDDPAPPADPPGKAAFDPQPPAGSSWAKDLATGKAASAEDGKPVILYFTFDG